MRPNIEQISNFDNEEKLLKGRFEKLIVVNGLLWVAEKLGITSISKIILPPHMRQELLIKYHKGIGAGHVGLKQTLFKLKERFYWPRING